MPASKTSPRKKPAAKRRRPSPFKLPQLEQRQLDLIGLGLIALGLFFAFLVYFGWDGGRAGSQAVEGLEWLLGAVHYVVPVALAATGAILILRPMLPAVRPFRSGAICLFASLTLGLAAGTLGLGPGGERPGWWDAQWVKTRGGMVGESLDWVVGTLTGSVGAHILAVFLFIAGVLLLTGASVAGVIKATSDSGHDDDPRGATSADRGGAERDLATLERSTRVRVKEAPLFDGPGEFDTTVTKSKRKPPKPPIDEPPDFNIFAPPSEAIAEPEPEPEPAPEPELDLPEPDAQPRLAEDPAEDEDGVKRGPAGPSSPSSSRRRAATAPRSPTRPTSSGGCPTRRC